jgi:hypothetical protein
MSASHATVPGGEGRILFDQHVPVRDGVTLSTDV